MRDVVLRLALFSDQKRIDERSSDLSSRDGEACTDVDEQNLNEWSWTPLVFLGLIIVLL